MNDMLNGLIIKALGGFYYVKTPKGVYTCRARGLFRKDGISPFVGDNVNLSIRSEDEGYITEILPRKNFMVRPPVANLDRLFVVVSLVDPVPNLQVIDKITAMAEYHDIEPIIVLTKCDLCNPQAVYDIYKTAGFEVLRVSNLSGEGTGEVKKLLSGKISAFAGNTGVGKSSLLNCFDVNITVETGETSKKLGRGRHTTRHVELFEIEKDSYIADTPGFSAMELTEILAIDKQELELCYREFNGSLGRCRFTGCSHRVEQGCAVLEAVAAGRIPKSRHESYVVLYNELEEIKPWEKKQKGR